MARVVGPCTDPVPGVIAPFEGPALEAPEVAEGCHRLQVCLPRRVGDPIPPEGEDTETVEVVVAGALLVPAETETETETEPETETETETEPETETETEPETETETDDTTAPPSDGCGCHVIAGRPPAGLPFLLVGGLLAHRIRRNRYSRVERGRRSRAAARAK